MHTQHQVPRVDRAGCPVLLRLAQFYDPFTEPCRTLAGVQEWNSEIQLLLYHRAADADQHTGRCCRDAVVVVHETDAADAMQ